MSRDAAEYESLSPRSHALVKPTMYIGSIAITPREEVVFDIEKQEMVACIVSVPPAVDRLCHEILGNACDAVRESRKAGIKPGNIIMDMNDKTISVKSSGLGIPIVKDSKSPEQYIPQTIFGQMLSGSNYGGKNREGNGTNGIGAKATNIFSTSFIIEIITSGVKYTQEWTCNMRSVGQPIIEKIKTKENSVKVTWTLDFDRFNMVDYDAETMALFARHAIDASFTAKIPIVFNGVEYNYIKSKDYARLYYGDAVATAIPMVIPNPDNKDYPIFECLFVDTPNGGNVVSFVNSIPTKNGGLHVEAVYEVFSNDIKKKIMKTIKPDKKSDKKPGEKEKCPITLKDIKNHVSVIVSCNLRNPDFSSQSKECLVSWKNQEEDVPNPEYKIANTTFKLTNWQLLDVLTANIFKKNRPTGKRALLGKRTTVAKAVDANKCTVAKERSKCILCVTEGNSAMGYFSKMMKCLGDRGRDYYGILPLKGKGLNVTKATEAKILGNAEITSLVEMLKLDELGETDYSIDANFKKLRYSRLMIMADADVDGKHVAGLIVNFFYRRYPTLLARGFVTNYVTPILRARYGKKVQAFYSYPAYEQWKDATPNSHLWKVNYFKGLGTSTDPDVKADVADPRVVVFTNDGQPSADAMRLAFGADEREERRNWIREHVPGSEIEYINEQPISAYIHNDLIQYSVDSVRRAIPRMSDGLKPSQAKLLHGVIQKFGVFNAKPSFVPQKTAQVAVFCAEKTFYHHGTAGLADTLTKMCYSFIGSNNIPLFNSEASIGTREKLGKDASDPRYTEMAPSPLLPYMFRKEDACLYKYVMEEIYEAEPETFFPIIPIWGLNGAQGIATGSATFVANHNPLDLVEYIKAYLYDEQLDYVIEPWYRNFKGVLRLEKGAMISEGTFRVNKSDVYIDEIPVYIASLKYAERVLGDLETRKVISNYDGYAVEDEARFELHGWNGPAPTLDSLHLKGTAKLSNMVLLDANGAPKKYANVEEILNDFCDFRLQKYQERKEWYENNYQSRINALEDKKRYIQAIVNGELDVTNFDETIVYPFMELHKLDRKLIDSTSTRDLTPKKIIHLDEEIDKLKQELESYKAVSAGQMWLTEIDEFLEKYKKVYKGSINTASTRYQ